MNNPLSIQFPILLYFATKRLGYPVKSLWDEYIDITPKKMVKFNRAEFLALAKRIVNEYKKEEAS